MFVNIQNTNVDSFSIPAILLCYASATNGRRYGFHRRTPTDLYSGEKNTIIFYHPHRCLLYNGPFYQNESFRMSCSVWVEKSYPFISFKSASLGSAYNILSTYEIIKYFSMQIYNLFPVTVVSFLYLARVGGWVPRMLMKLLTCHPVLVHLDKSATMFSGAFFCVNMHRISTFRAYYSLTMFSHMYTVP